MNSLLCNFLKDWGRSIKQGIGNAGVIIFLVVFSICALWLTYCLVKAIVTKSKSLINWGQLFFLIVFILLIIWFATIL